MKRIETLLTVAGLGLFAFVVSKVGWSTVVYELRTVWIALPVLVAFSVVRLLLQTQSWGLALREEGVATRFGELIGIRLASQSMGYLSVLGPAISELMKIKLLGHNWQKSTTATVANSGSIGSPPFSSASWGAWGRPSYWRRASTVRHFWQSQRYL